MSPLRAFLLVAAALLVATPAIAQTTAAPLEGEYADLYVVAGRALDSEGRPVPQGLLIIEMPGAQPLRAAANCKGDFITSFPLRNIDSRDEARITLVGPPGGKNVTTTVPLDPFYRRSDAILRLESPWGMTCPENQDVFDVSASVAVRLLNRTTPYDRDGATFHARPHTGLVTMRFHPPDGNPICPPNPQPTIPGNCEIFQADPRGDIRYTFTLDQPFPGGGRVELELRGTSSQTSDGSNITIDVPIDPTTRIGWKYFEVSGQGPPAELYKTPQPGVVAILLAASVAVAARSLFTRRPR